MTEPGLTPIDDPGACFIREARASGAEVVELSDLQALPELLMQRAGQPDSLALHSGSPLSKLDWPCRTDEDPRGGGGWGVVWAWGGIAETGSLCFTDDQVSSELLFLVEFLACVLPRDALVARQEMLWPLLLGEQRRAPRALHLVTGPSRTADVEQTLQVGAHGPREVVIYLLGS